MLLSSKKFVNGITSQVPISDLQQQTICLLFFEDNSECRLWTEKLKKLYVARKDFEVVVVFSATFGHDPRFSISSSKERRELHFWKVFLDMPWLAIPFADPKCVQLWRIFNKMHNDCQAPKLMIIYSKGNYFEENGFEVLQKTGFQNYPFMSTSRATMSSRRNNVSSALGRIELFRAEDLGCGPGVSSLHYIIIFKMCEYAKIIVISFCHKTYLYIGRLQYIHSCKLLKSGM